MEWMQRIKLQGTRQGLVKLRSKVREVAVAAGKIDSYTS